MNIFRGKSEFNKSPGVFSASEQRRLREQNVLISCIWSCKLQLKKTDDANPEKACTVRTVSV